MGVSLHRIPIHQVQAGGFDTAIRHNPSMARPLRLVLSSIGVLLGLVALLLAAGQITLTYYLPSQSGIATTHTTTFAPGIAATAVAAVMLLITIGWLILAAVRAVRPWLFAIPVAALIISYAVTIAVMGMPRPSF